MHIIRLRGPWRLVPVARFLLQDDGSYLPVTDDLPPAGTVKPPADWSSILGPDFLGRARYERSFNKPTGLESGERVFLVIEPPRSESCILLQDELVGFVYPGEGPKRFDITDRLDSHNRLAVFVDHPALDCLRSKVGDPAATPPGGLIGEVRLEIED